MKLNLKDCLIPAVALTLIGALVTAALAGVNLLTKDTIAQRTKETEDAARKEVLAADSFTDKILTTPDGEIAYCEAVRDGNVIGYIFTVTTSGKSSGLTVMTGVKTDGAVSGVAITENSETAGYVDKVIGDGLLDRIVAAGNADVDTTSNATRTSKGILKGVDQALGYYAQITGEVTQP